MQIEQYYNRSGTLVETASWEGYKWRRYPESKHFSIRLYFRRSERTKNEPLRHFWLHKEVWKATHGNIPEGHDIHHIDEDTTNNNIENLQAITRSDHSKLHIDHIYKAIAAAPEWHRSEEGRAWHKQHAKNVAAAQPLRKRTCQHCQIEYETTANRSTVKYCSNACRTYARKAAKRDHEPRQCVVCQQEFIVDKYAKILTCSSACKCIRMSASALQRRARERLQPCN
jgi:hypothetical protein